MAFAAASCVVDVEDDRLSKDGLDQLGDDDSAASSAQALSKGAVGAVNGVLDYCNDPSALCVSGEGDCDSNRHCSGGTICVRNNGTKFGLPGNYDVCAPPHCANMILDGGETSIDCGGGCGVCMNCVGTPGANNFCTGCSCASGQGDCDADSECQAGLICAAGNGPNFGLPGAYDVCVPAHCANGVLDAGSGETDVDAGGPCGTAVACTGTPGASGYCQGCKCAAGQGDCDADSECASGLTCAGDNGAKFGFPTGWDVCVPPYCTNGVQDSASGETGIDVGGPCGVIRNDLMVSAATNLGTDNSGSRSCADGGDAVSYSVTALAASSATLSAAPSSGCLAPGDELLLINLQGSAAHFVNVGNYETLTVTSVVGTHVTFSSAKARFYGDGASDDTNLGTNRANQRVMLQRVPNYKNVNVAAAASLTGNAWDGVRGGVLFLRAAGTVSVAGTVSMSGKGYDGGARITRVNANGIQGESVGGLGANLSSANQGAGGGGIGDRNGCQSFGTSAGGGGYGVSGSKGLNFCSGAGGLTYGELTLMTKLMLGSGGGSGGTDDYLGDNPPGGFGGRGGGIVVILGSQLNVTGAILAAGARGEGDDPTLGCQDGGSISACWDYSGPGGGGSGGSILFRASTAALGSNLVTAVGGLGGDGVDGAASDGGVGGVGRIAIQYVSSLSGTTLPAASQGN